MKTQKKQKHILNIINSFDKTVKNTPEKDIREVLEVLNRKYKFKLNIETQQDLNKCREK